MSIYKFDREDVIRSVVKSYPQVTFKIYKGEVFTNIHNVENMYLNNSTFGCESGLDFSCEDNSGFIGVI